MEYKKANYKDILSSLQELIRLSGEEVKINTILIVGSNSNIYTKKEIAKNSDIDFIILNQNKHFSIKEKFQGISYDISFINQNDIISVVLGALNGSPFFGKVFSSISSYSLIKDTDNIGVEFVSVVKYIYDCFIGSYLPNFGISTIALHNIDANKKDLKKSTIEERSFAFYRLSEHIFNYISYLAYPMSTSGSYRGKIIERRFKYFINNEKNKSIFDENSIKKIVKKTLPVFEYEFYGLVDNKNIQDAISKNKITQYYYGYDNLIQEEKIVFISKKDVLKNNFTITDVNNIIPFLTRLQLGVYTSFLIFLSKKYQEISLEKRISFLLKVFNILKGEKLHEVIIKTLKSLLIIKSVYFLDEEEKEISVGVFNDWLLQFKVDFNLPKTSITNINLKEILNIIKDSTTQREIEIKTCDMFFGIMKSLRINMEDLDFQYNS